MIDLFWISDKYAQVIFRTSGLCSKRRWINLEKTPSLIHKWHKDWPSYVTGTIFVETSINSLLLGRSVLQISTEMQGLEFHRIWRSTVTFIALNKKDNHSSFVVKLPHIAFMLILWSGEIEIQLMMNSVSCQSRGARLTSRMIMMNLMSSGRVL